MTFGEIEDRMTDTTLPPGRELDAEQQLFALDDRVAVEIMGWEVFVCGYFATDEETDRMRELRDWMDRVGLQSVGTYFIDVEEDLYIPTGNFRPSTSIADAKRVWGKMQADGWNVDILTDGKGWSVKFWRADGTSHVKWADEIPRAACYAALQAQEPKP